MNDIRRGGTPDIEFAANGLLARNFLASGQSEGARKTITDLRSQFTERELTRFLPNMDAMLCRIALHTGDLDEADVWYRVKAPREPMHINILKRYQYFTQAMVELANGKPDSALLTITPMEPYCTACMRYIDTIHLKVLTAIALYQKRDEAWREPLTAALALAEEYRFIRTVSVYGAAVLPLLDALEWSGNAKWRKRLMADVRAQAAIYPRFLQPRLSMSEALTAAEMQVLRLICADKSNAEIGEILNIRVSTVKSHVSSVLSKLGVNRRSEARTAAKKLWLISEDQ
jgi:LuxR family maltose regulon positive regulatory protein